MSFGFSVGDFIAVGKLINDIVKCLQSVGGAKSEYQEMIREFEILTKALVHIDHLKAADEQMTAQLNYIKFAALSCRYQLQDFMTKMKEYDSSLGIKARMDMMRKTARKLRWSFGPSGDIKQLRMYLNTHVGTINMLLAQYGLEQMTSAGVKSEEHFMQVSRKLDKNQALLVDVKSDTSDIGTSLGRLLAAIRENRLTTDQIHTSMLEIQSSLGAVDIRMTYTQRPFYLEDALGFRYPVPSEFDYDMLDTIVRRRFRQGAGSQDVALGNYEFVRTNQRSLVITAISQLTPGTSIVMAIIVKADMKKGCPTPGCTSLRSHPHPGGGLACSHCGVWFDQSTKRRQELEDRVNEIEGLSISVDNTSRYEPVNSQDPAVSGTEQSLKNVKIAQPDQSPKIASKQKLDDASDPLRCDTQGCTRSFTGPYRKVDLNRHKR